MYIFTIDARHLIICRLKHRGIQVFLCDSVSAGRICCSLRKLKKVHEHIKNMYVDLYQDFTQAVLAPLAPDFLNFEIWVTRVLKIQSCV